MVKSIIKTRVKLEKCWTLRIYKIFSFFATDLKIGTNITHEKVFKWVYFGGLSFGEHGRN